MSYSYGFFPHTRLRRLRSQAWLRDLVEENTLSTNDLIWPLFIREKESPAEISSMPSIYRYTLDQLEKILCEAINLGIKAIALFPTTPGYLKTEDGREATNPENLICRACRLIKIQFPNLGIITDVALDPYTSHGHDGILKNGLILNDETVEVLAQQALIQAQAGADILAPSDMMDGRIQAIRRQLDESHFQDKAILSYSAKYASSFYGPFRDAVGAEKLQGTSDKKSYQMNPSNREEAIREVAQDLEEGADMVMIKPGLPYLDVICEIKQTFKVPTFAYQVSGEYSMIRAASLNGWLDYEKTILETMIAFKRAGTDGILTYAALDVARFLK
jgi:porphobilinogen synthase